MREQFYYALFVLIFGISILCLGFYMTKYRFFNNKAFKGIKDIIPFPYVVNYWIFKLLFIIGGFIVLLAGTYGVFGPLF